jgi:hypothetical protein
LAQFSYAALNGQRRHKLRFETGGGRIAAEPRQLRRDYGATAQLILLCGFTATERTKNARQAAR